MSMSPDASDKLRGGCATQVPTVDLGGSVANADTSNEPQRFLSGLFRGSHEQWATVDKEASRS